MGPINNGGGKNHQIWRNPFHKPTPSNVPKLPPDQFVCPISGNLMLDPVNVSSGHTFERTSVQICKDLAFVPTLADGSTPDFSGSLFPNRAIRSMIQQWCDENSVERPKVDYYAVEDAVRSLIAESNANLYTPPAAAEEEEEYYVQQEQVGDSVTDLLDKVAYNPQVNISHAVTLPHMRRNTDQFGSGSSSANQHPVTPLNFKTKPASYSSSPTAAAGVAPGPFKNPDQRDGDDDEDDDRLLMKLMSSDVSEQEEGVVSLRNLTRTDERTRASLCTPRMLSIIRPLILSRNATIQVNAVASLVNLSLEKHNKAMIVGAGLVPPLIEVLRGGFPESQEHAAGALFSLSLEEDNQTAIGVLGGLEPLLNSLRSESDRTRHDSALALYHLSLNQSNRVKLIKLGAIPILLNLLKSKNMTGRAILVLCNLALCTEGKSALLDGNAVMILVSMLRENDFDTEATLENVVATLCAMSQGSLRFRGMAKEAGAVEVLRVIEERAKSERARERARRVLQMMSGRGEEEIESNGGFGGRMFEGGGTMSQTRFRTGYGGGRGGGGGGRDLYTVNTTRF
ncbi:hypothetical protein QQ045_012485 [Rhodiola kirilowii]